MNIKYKFSKFKISKSTYLSVDVESPDYYVLGKFRAHNWTPTLAQEIIDGVDGSRTKSFSDAYAWGNEDVIDLWSVFSPYHSITHRQIIRFYSLSFIFEYMY